MATTATPAAPSKKPLNHPSLDHFMRCAWVNAVEKYTYREFCHAYGGALTRIYYGNPLESPR